MTIFQNNKRASSYLHEGVYLGQKEKRYLVAIETLNKALEIDPKYIAALSYRSHFYYDTKQYEKAIADVKNIFEITGLNPDNYAQSYWFLGDCYLGLNEFDQAIENYRKSIEYDFYEELPLAGRGYAYLKKGQYDLAILDLNKAIEIDSKRAKPYLYRADYYLALGKKDLAIEDLKEVIELSGDDEEKKEAESKLKEILK